MSTSVRASEKVREMCLYFAFFQKLLRCDICKWLYFVSFFNINKLLTAIYSLCNKYNIGLLCICDKPETAYLCSGCWG